MCVYILFYIFTYIYIYIDMRGVSRQLHLLRQLQFHTACIVRAATSLEKQSCLRFHIAEKHFPSPIR